MLKEVPPAQRHQPYDSVSASNLMSEAVSFSYVKQNYDSGFR